MTESTQLAASSPPPVAPAAPSLSVVIPLFLIAIFLALAGLQLVMMGLLAEVGIRTYHGASDRTPDAIRDRLNCGDTPLA